MGVSSPNWAKKAPKSMLRLGVGGKGGGISKCHKLRMDQVEIPDQKGRGDTGEQVSLLRRISGWKKQTALAWINRTYLTNREQKWKVANRAQGLRRNRAGGVAPKVRLEKNRVVWGKLSLQGENTNKKGGKRI